MQRFEYLRASTVDAAVEAFGRPDARRAHYLGGGTTLVDLMKIGVEAPDRIVDVTGIGGLDRVEIGEGGGLSIGALARMSDVAEHPMVKRDHPMLSESLWKAASQQLRNMATVGGNLMQRTRCAYFRGTEYPCNKREPGTGCSAVGGENRTHAILGGSASCIAVHPSDWAVALTALDATIVVAGPGGERRIPIHGLLLEPGDTPQRENSLAPGEMLMRIEVPRSATSRASTYHKVRDRESYAFAIASAAVGLSLDGGTVREARIALGGLATRPWRARAAEAALVGSRIDEECARRVGAIALQGARTTPANAFRAPLGAATVAQAIIIAAGRA